MGVVAVWEMARHRYRQSQLAGLTRMKLDEIGRERQAQRAGAERRGNADATASHRHGAHDKNASVPESRVRPATRARATAVKLGQPTRGWR